MMLLMIWFVLHGTASKFQHMTVRKPQSCWVGQADLPQIIGLDLLLKYAAKTGRAVHFLLVQL
jgi:hypothetical protein